MEQWTDINNVLTESMNWINQTRRIEQDWKIHSVEEQIKKTEVCECVESILEELTRKVKIKKEW